MPRIRDRDVVVQLTEQAAEGSEPEPLEVELRDGSRALLRPILPEDKPLLQDGLTRLSSDSRYLRCHRVVEGLSEEDLRYLTEVDHRDHVAWVALDASRADLPGMGIGRYVRLVDTPSVAEMAITVTDDHQGKGLGTLLLAVMTPVARANGIEVFRNYVLADNEAMLNLLNELGATERRCGPETYEVDFPLPEDPDDLPETPAGRAIRAFAEHQPGPCLSGFAILPDWLTDLRQRESRSESTDASSSGRERGTLAEWMDVNVSDDADA